MPPKKAASGRAPERRISFEFAAILATSNEHWLRASEEKTNEFPDELQIQKVKRTAPTAVHASAEYLHVGKGVEKLWITLTDGERRCADPIVAQAAPAQPQGCPHPCACANTLSRRVKSRPSTDRDAPTSNNHLFHIVRQRQTPPASSLKITADYCLTPSGAIPKIRVPPGTPGRLAAPERRPPARDRHEENVSTQQPEAQADPRFSCPHGHSRRPQGHQRAARQRTKAPLRLTRR